MVRLGMKFECYLPYEPESPASLILAQTKLAQSKRKRYGIMGCLARGRADGPRLESWSLEREHCMCNFIHVSHLDATALNSRTEALAAGHVLLDGVISELRSRPGVLTFRNDPGTTANWTHKSVQW